MTAAILESKCVAKLLKAMQTFPKARSLQWKVGQVTPTMVACEIVRLAGA